MTTKKNFPVNSQHGSSVFLLKDIHRNTKRIFTSEQSNGRNPWRTEYC